jgi:WD40 repeat protein
MNIDLKCVEWLNLNRNARQIKNDKQKKDQVKSNPELANHPDYQLSTNYVLQITGSNDNNSLACLTSDKIVQIYDQNILKLKNKITCYQNEAKLTVNEIGFFKQNNEMIFSCMDNGKLDCWDLRSDNLSNASICFSGLSVDDKREFLCSDINSLDELLIIGTNKTIDNCQIYVYDIRNTQKYLFKFSESHSNDVSQVKFDPFYARKFCSASVDGLVCLYDLDLKPDEQAESNQNSSDLDKTPSKLTQSDNESDDEISDDEEEDPDFMDQVLNADSSIQKIGYLISNRNQKEADQLYAITFTNDIFVWDLKTYDVVYKKQSKNKNVLSGNLLDENDDKEEDYYFNCFYDQASCLTVCMGDKNGTIKLYQNDNLVYETDRTLNNQEKRFHKDIIRGAYWNNSIYLYTAGEDGFLFKWDVIDKKIKSQSRETVEEEMDKKSIKRERLQLQKINKQQNNNKNENLDTSKDLRKKPRLNDSLNNNKNKKNTNKKNNFFNKNNKKNSQ